MTHKNILLIILFLAGVAAGYVLYGQRETASVYRSAEHGYSFAYPEGYFIHESPDAVRALEDTPEARDLAAGTVVGELPASLVVRTYPAEEGTDLKEWIMEDERAGFSLAGRDLEPVTVDGLAGFRYVHSGLYEAEAAAFLHEGRIYVLEGEYIALEDEIRSHYQNLLRTFSFR